MTWSDATSPEDQIDFEPDFERIYKRGDRLRLRRRLVQGGLSALAVTLIAGIGFLGLASTSARPSKGHAEAEPIKGGVRAANFEVKGGIRQWIPDPPGSKPPPTPSLPSAPRIILSRGDPIGHGFWYSVELASLPPHASLRITCHDSVDPEGFWIAIVYADTEGQAKVPNLCYSREGPDHWISVGDSQSNHVKWQATSTPALAPFAEGAKVELARGKPAVRGGWWYSIGLSGFKPNAMTYLTCMDSADPDGFFTRAVTTDAAGRFADQAVCYSSDGSDHWVTANGVESNRVRW